MTSFKKYSFGGAIVGIALCLAALAAWATHVVAAITALTGGTTASLEYGVLLVAGVILPPIGVIHGAGLWFGAW